MRTRSLITLFSIIIITVACATAIAQVQNTTSKHLMREDSAAVNALVMYPDTVRLHIFEACEYPAAIVSIASLQKNSSSDFANLIAVYSKSEQEDFWNLGRYPGLISSLAQGAKKSADQINAILVDYPADIHETALKYGTDYYDQIRQIDQIQSQTDSQFEQIIADYPPETQTALRDIIQFPEVISLLNDHLSLTVRVGDHFRRNPQGVLRRADSLNLVETRQNAENAEAWKQTIEQNPDEAADLQGAASQYAADNGYTQAAINTAPSPDEVSNYTCSPYSFWFGYPTWYPYSYWYPYPYWFDCGFYHDRSGRLVIMGSPSYYFSNWYFYYPEHWQHYPNLCNAYIDHYYGPKRSVGGNYKIVHDWVRNNKNYLPDDFITNNSRRTGVIRQLGQLNVDAQKQRGGKPVALADRDQYFQNNRSRYPSLNAGKKTRMQRSDQQDNTPVVLQRPIKQPPVRIDRLTEQSSTSPIQATTQRLARVPEPAQQPATSPIQTSTPRPIRAPEPAQQPASSPIQASTPRAIRVPEPAQQPDKNPGRAPAPAAYNFNSINKAQEYHKDAWEQTQPIEHPQPQPAPRAQVQQPVRQAPMSRQASDRRK